jgi:hypothetical protein
MSNKIQANIAFGNILKNKHFTSINYTDFAKKECGQSISGYSKARGFQFKLEDEIKSEH